MRCKPGSKLEELLNVQIQVWPEHGDFLKKSFDGRTESLMESAHHTAELIYKMIAPALEEHARSYRWMCGALNEEAIHFFRTGAYRHHSFAEVEKEVYGNSSYMTPYVQGLLMSQIYWLNHAQVIDEYVRVFVPGFPDECRFLEIGPGHALFCGLAAENTRVASVEAWDVSVSSLEFAGECLRKLGLGGKVRLELRDVAKSGGRVEKFDRIVISEVLEHLEDPVSVLRGIRRHLAPGGKVFINVPVNSPAPDHIYLLGSPEEARALIEKGGFDVREFHSYPVTGYTEEAARRKKLSISCVATAIPKAGS